jgi:hypothetical protein
MRLGFERRPGGFLWQGHYRIDETVFGAVSMRGGHSNYLFVAIYPYRVAM